MIKEYPDLGEVVYEHALENGLLIRVVKKSEFSTVHAFLAVNYGSMDVRYRNNEHAFVSPNGVAHYLEHKMFDMPDGNVMQLFSQYGGSPNAFTSYDITAYYVECTERFEDNLALLLRYVFTPYFTQDSVDKERGIIAQEIKMYEDSPDSRVFENLYEAMYAQHPLRNSIAGTVESIEKVTAQTLYDCYHSFYTPENMMLCVVGDVDPESVVELAERLTPAKKDCGLPQCDYGEPESMEPSNAKVVCAMEVSMPMFALGFKTEPAPCGDEAMLQQIVGDLAAEILIGESSELYTKLYEAGLIDTGFSCGYEGLKGAALLTASGDSRDPMAVRDAILSEAARICREGIDGELFDRLKKSMLGRKMRSLDSFSGICYRICAYHFEGVDYFSFPELFRRVDAQQIQSFLARTVTKDRCAISIIEPVG